MAYENRGSGQTTGTQQGDDMGSSSGNSSGNNTGSGNRGTSQNDGRFKANDERTREMGRKGGSSSRGM